MSFKHTDLFLTRVSEKALVELWGPMLKKCRGMGDAVG